MPTTVKNSTAMARGHSSKDVEAQELPAADSERGEGSEEAVLSEWLPGDMLWARVGRHPFWPCVVVVDPQNAKYFETKRVGRGRTSQQQQIHVQYFGDNGSRSWVSTNQILKYTGKNNLLKLAETKKKDKKYSSSFVQPGKNQKWDYAVQEAEEAALKSSNERILYFEEYYPIRTKYDNVASEKKERVNERSSQKSGTEAIRKEEIEESPQMDNKDVDLEQDIPRKTKKRNLKKANFEENLTGGAKLTQRKVKRRKAHKKPPGIFEVFVDRCAHLFAIDRPEFQEDRAKCIRFMRAMWSAMTEEEKSRYHGSYEDVELLKE